MTYSDEQVITLLKESVPVVPEAPARVDSVRRLAARQRSFVSVQVVGAAASLVLLLAAVAAIARPPQKVGDVQPVGEPVATMVSAILGERSFRFELRSRLDGPPSAQWGDGTKGSRATGVFGMDGTLHVTGTEPVLFGGGSEEAELRVVDGKTYVRATEEDDLPPGKRWMRSTEEMFTRDSIRTFFDGFRRHLSEVRYAGQDVVRGEPVATYTAKLAGAALGMEGGVLDATFALDADGRARRMSVTMRMANQGVSVSTTMTLELYDFGTKVDVKAPPESEVVDDDLGDVVSTEVTTSETTFGVDEYVERCAQSAGSEETLRHCLTVYESQGNGVTCTPRWESREKWTYRCTDGKSGSRGQ